MFLACLFVICLDNIFLIFYVFPLSYALYISDLGFIYIINWMLVCYQCDNGGLIGGIIRLKKVKYLEKQISVHQ